jgi:uncharacterized protein (DUF342 family)
MYHAYPFARIRRAPESKGPMVENPLKKFFPVEDREDGVYIKVSLDIKDKLKIEDIAACLKGAFVTNADIEKIKEAINHARNGFEKIGPLFEYYNPELDKFVDINVTPMKAAVSVSSVAISNDIKVTDTALAFCLRRKGIVFGLKIDSIRDIAHNAVFDREEVIAEGKPAVDGENARLVFEVDLEKGTRPKEGQSGKVDYRNIHSIVQVGQGQVIARKEPPGKGTPGMDVSGQEIPATPGTDITIKPGKNTFVSEDGKYLKAAKSGYIYKQGEIINVGEQLTIKKDVDFSVGNIKYSGDVEVDGNILPGFTVETDGNVVIKGEAESAKIISRNGSVTIEKGIIGKNDMFVTAKKEINIVFAQAAVISTEGMLNIGKYFLHCNAVCDSAIGSQPHAAVIGGTITAFSKIEIDTVGNDKGVETKLAVVDKEEQAINDKLKELVALEKKLETEIEPIKRQLKAKAAILKLAGGQTSQRQTEELKKWLDVYNKLVVKLKYVQEKTGALSAELKKPRLHSGFIKITGDVFPGTEVNLYGMTKVVKVHIINKMFRVKDGAVFAEG